MKCWDDHTEYKYVIIQSEHVMLCHEMHLDWTFKGKIMVQEVSSVSAGGLEFDGSLVPSLQYVGVLQALVASAW